VLAQELPGEAFTAAFRDNLTLRYQGIRYGDLSGAQQAQLVRLAEVYAGRIREGHDRVRMDEVTRHLDDMHFAWMGGVDADSVFYYRLHSPVILIEFDHQRGIVFDNDQPSRHHIHTVVRTPNGNDYGKDLLRQHHEQFDHARSGHAHTHAPGPA
jgi:predicted DNA-binding protein with PD1-like motif